MRRHPRTLWSRMADARSSARVATLTEAKNTPCGAHLRDHAGLSYWLKRMTLPALAKLRR